MAFLTIIAPLVALTYPIDKVTDGKAQGFDVWFKEYIFNLLLQPLHLLLYTILVGSAMELATENIIYSIVVLGFMTPAEKLLRQMFNFQKASTPGLFAGAAGAGLLMTGMRWLMGKGSGSKSSESGSQKSGSKEEDDDDLVNKGTKSKKIKDYGSILGGDGVDQPISKRDFFVSKGEQEQIRNMDQGFLESQMVVQREKVQKASNSRAIFQENEKLLAMQDEMKRRKSMDKTPQASESLTPTQAKKIERRRALKNSFNAYKEARGKMFKRDIVRGKPIKRIAKTVTGALGAATFGTAAAAIGMASGDFAKVGQYGTLGVAGGYALGAGQANRMSEDFEGDGALKSAIKEYKLNTTDMDELKRQKDEEIKRKAKENRKLQDEYREKYEASKEEYEKWVEDYYLLLDDNKVPDSEKIDTFEFAKQEEEQGVTNALPKTILAATTRRRRGLDKIKTKEELSAAKENFEKELSSQGIPQKNIEEEWNRAIRFNDKMNK